MCCSSRVSAQPCVSSRGSARSGHGGLAGTGTGGDSDLLPAGPAAGCRGPGAGGPGARVPRAAPGTRGPAQRAGAAGGAEPGPSGVGPGGVGGRAARAMLSLAGCRRLWSGAGAMPRKVRGEAEGRAGLCGGRPDRACSSVSGERIREGTRGTGRCRGTGGIGGGRLCEGGGSRQARRPVQRRHRWVCLARDVVLPAGERGV